MSRLGFDEQGRALAEADQDAAEETDPLKLAAKAQSAAVHAAVEAIQGRDATPDNIGELLRHAAQLPDPKRVLLDGGAPVWERWVAVLASTPLNLAARRDLVTVTCRLPEAQRVTVLERVFRVPVGADARAVDAVDDLLEDAAAQPIADDETARIEGDETLVLAGPEAVLEGLLDAPVHADELVEALTPAAEVTLSGEGVERQVDVAGFVRACAPSVAAIERATAVMTARFGGGPPIDEEDAWWRQVARLRRRFPALVDALEAARDGAPQTVAVRGGYARIDLAAGTLGVYMPASADANRA